jgi:hypothetical protein
MKNCRQLARHACVCVSFYQYSVPNGTTSIIKPNRFPKPVRLKMSVC